MCFPGGGVLGGFPWRDFLHHFSRKALINYLNHWHWHWCTFGGGGGEGGSPLSSHAPANCGPVQLGKSPENKLEKRSRAHLLVVVLVLCRCYWPCPCPFPCPSCCCCPCCCRFHCCCCCPCPCLSCCCCCCLVVVFFVTFRTYSIKLCSWDFQVTGLTPSWSQCGVVVLFVP